MSTSIWVAKLKISSRVSQKLSGKHGLSATDVTDAVQCVSGLVGAWNESQERGRRMLIKCTIRGMSVLVVLYPTADPTVWHLGSAYPVR